MRKINKTFPKIAAMGRGGSGKGQDDEQRWRTVFQRLDELSTGLTVMMELVLQAFDVERQQDSPPPPPPTPPQTHQEPPPPPRPAQPHQQPLAPQTTVQPETVEVQPTQQDIQQALLELQREHALRTMVAYQLQQQQLQRQAYLAAMAMQRPEEGQNQQQNQEEEEAKLNEQKSQEEEKKQKEEATKKSEDEEAAEEMKSDKKRNRDEEPGHLGELNASRKGEVATGLAGPCSWKSKLKPVNRLLFSSI